MALSQSVLSELLDAFRSGEGVDLVRDAVRLVMQELIETDAIGHAVTSAEGVQKIGRGRRLQSHRRRITPMAPTRW